MSSRKKVVAVAQQYVGCKIGDNRHKKLVDTFNKVQPHGEKATYNSAWCAIAWTAWQILAGNGQSVVPYSYNCGTLVAYAKKLGIWVENDNYLPKPGDAIIYNWSDSGKGDLDWGASHVGIVEKVVGSTITLIEGNKGTTGTCARRHIQRNQRYIRGYIAPKYNDGTYPGTLPVGTLKYGSKGTQVERLQKFLNWAIDAGLKVDGKWVNATERAVRVFCISVGLIKNDNKDRIIWGPKCLAKAKSFKKLT